MLPVLLQWPGYLVSSSSTTSKGSLKRDKGLPENRFVRMEMTKMKFTKLTLNEPTTDGGSETTFVNLSKVTEFTGVSGGGTQLMFDCMGPNNQRAETFVKESPDEICALIGLV